jgi:predicted transcriptional regulator
MSSMSRSGSSAPAQLSKYERGLSTPPLEVILRLKRHYGKSIDWIVTGEG